MHEAIRNDTLDQIAGFITHLKATLDPSRYPKSSDGTEFDTALRALEQDFERIKRLFHDCLIAQWSEDIERDLQEQLDSSRKRHGANENGNAR